MIDDILKSTKASASVLADIKNITKDRLDKTTVFPLLQEAVNLKLMIEEKEEQQIKNLVIMSIKSQDMRAGNLSDDVIRRQIKRYDCHQTSLVAQKKTLLIMFIEKELAITLNDDDAVGIQTLEQLTEILIKYMKEKTGYGY